MSDTVGTLYQAKAGSYYEYVRHEIIPLIEGQGLRILDIGCGRGATLIELKRLGKASEIVGVELNADAIAATRHLLDNVIIGNFEQVTIDYPEGYFDAIIMADVLEHLVDPWGAVRNVRKYLRAGGILVASLPNVREIGMIHSLVCRGDFRYRDAGLMDRSHLRFFCKRNMLELFADGFELQTVRTVPDLTRGRRAWFNRLTLRAFEEFFVTQYLIVARNKAGAALPVQG